jgi:GT2 family glycosyltransferase
MLRNLALAAKSSFIYRLFLGRWVNRRRIRDASRLVNSLHKAAFGRLADPDGLAAGVRQLHSGMPVQVLAEQLAASTEFQARHGTSRMVDAKYVTALYRDGLGREPDPEGLASWSGTGATQAEVLATFARSDEALEKASPAPAILSETDAERVVNSLYKTALGRGADASGLADCMSQLQSGVSVESVAAQLVDSAEFRARHGSSQTVDIPFITALYRDGLGREPDPQCLASWLGTGGTQAEVLARFAHSDEALEKASPASASVSEIDAERVVNSLYKTALGRGADASGLADCMSQLQSGVSVESVAAQLVGSAEFRARHGSSQTVDIPFITALYRDGLEREPDPEGLATWSGTGATQAEVLARFARSDEALKKASPAPANFSKIDAKRVVNSLYKAAFGRGADPSGFTNCMCQLESGVSLESMAAQLVDSAEFRARHGPSPKIDLEYLRALYRDALGCQPDLSAFMHWFAEGKRGATKANVLAAIAGSAEALKMSSCSKGNDAATYERWVKLNDTISDADRVAIRAHIAGLPLRPLISVILASSDSSEIPLRKSFDSLVTQLYPYWEMCVTRDDTTESVWTSILGDRTTNDPLVRIARAEASECVAAITNKALGLATGEFVAFLRAGDLLPEHALYEVALEIGANPDADVLYSDQDQIGDAGKRLKPWFKPGWDPDLLLAHNYMGDLVVYRHTLLEKIGCLRTGFEGAEFHDLALRATAATTAGRIRHIPAILYHRRGDDKVIHSENALLCLRAIAASHRAVRDHLDSRGDTGAALKPAPEIPSAIRVTWPVPEPSPLVSVIVPTRDRADLLAQCAGGVLRRTDYCNLELLIVDNGSIEPATHVLYHRLTGEDSRVRVLSYPGPFNYSALNNAAAREAKGEILLLLNNDIDVIDSSWMREMISHALRPDVGIVGAKLLYANELVQHAGVVLGPEGQMTHLCRFANKCDPGYFGQLALPRTLSVVTGACVAIRRSVFFEVGGLDEANLHVAYNDVDLCLRLGDYGYRVIWTPFAELFHLESVSRGVDSEDPARLERSYREWQHLRATWGSLLASTDPFHNPNVLFYWNGTEIPSSPRRQKPWYFIVEQVSNFDRDFSLMNNASIESNSQ